MSKLQVLIAVTRDSSAPVTFKEHKDDNDYVSIVIEPRTYWSRHDLNELAALCKEAAKRIATI